MKLNPKLIAETLREAGRRSNDHNIEDSIMDKALEMLDPYFTELVDEVISAMEDLEHPEPRTKAEYDERIGADRD